MTIQVMLSVPIPSEDAKFIGHILSNIISIILDIPSPGKTALLFPGEPPAFPVIVPLLFGEPILFLPGALAVVVEPPLLDFDGEDAASLKVLPLCLYFYFYS